MYVLFVFVHTLDAVGYSPTSATVERVVRWLKWHQQKALTEELDTQVEQINLDDPSVLEIRVPPETLWSIIKKLDLNRPRSVRHCHGGGRKKKASLDMLHNFCEVLGDAYKKVKLSGQRAAERVYVGDEVGIILTDHEVKILTTRETIRADFEHPHVTVMIWENCLGEYGPPFLIFTGDSENCIPTEVIEMAKRDELWYDWNSEGHMDDETYLRFRRLQIEWLRKKHGDYNPDDPSTELIWIVDNHYSHLSFSSVLLAAVHGIHDIVGCGGLTQCWQARTSLLFLFSPQRASLKYFAIGE